MASGAEIARANDFDMEPCGVTVCIEDEGGSREVPLPTVFMDTTPDQINDLNVEQEVVVQIKGKITNLFSKEGRADMSMAVRELEIKEAMNPFEELANE